VIETSAFDQGPGGPMHAGTEGCVLLAPTAAATEGAKDATKVQVSHGPMVPKEGLTAALLIPAGSGGTSR
jgi:hypothetical protein